MRGPRAALLLCGVAAYCFLFYSLTNHFPIRAPSALPFLPLEGRIPLVPGSVWLYLSYFPLLVISGVVIARQPWIGRAAGALALVITLSGIVFLIHPTTIERLPFTGGGLSASVLRWVRSIDPPNNCFPSLHVGLAACCSLAWRKAEPRRGAILLLWAGLIAVSTLTTKQHYLLDVLGGLLVATIAWIACFLLRPGISRRPEESGRGSSRPA